MPNRFSTEAANADIMGEDAPIDGAAKESPVAAGAGGALPDRSGPMPQRRARRGGAEAQTAKAGESTQAARPGQGLDAAGSIQDKDAAKP